MNARALAYEDGKAAKLFDRMGVEADQIAIGRGQPFSPKATNYYGIVNLLLCRSGIQNDLMDSDARRAYYAEDHLPRRPKGDTCADCGVPLLLSLAAFRQREDGRMEHLHLACAAADPDHPFGSSS